MTNPYKFIQFYHTLESIPFFKKILEDANLPIPLEAINEIETLFKEIAENADVKPELLQGFFKVLSEGDLNKMIIFLGQNNFLGIKENLIAEYADVFSSLLEPVIKEITKKIETQYKKTEFKQFWELFQNQKYWELFFELRKHQPESEAMVFKMFFSNIRTPAFITPIYSILHAIENTEDIETLLFLEKMLTLDTSSQAQDLLNTCLKSGTLQNNEFLKKIQAVFPIDDAVWKNIKKELHKKVVDNKQLLELQTQATLHKKKQIANQQAKRRDSESTLNRQFIDRGKKTLYQKYLIPLFNQAVIGFTSAITGMAVGLAFPVYYAYMKVNDPERLREPAMGFMPNSTRTLFLMSALTKYAETSELNASDCKEIIHIFSKLYKINKGTLTTLTEDNSNLRRILDAMQTEQTKKNAQKIISSLNIPERDKHFLSKYIIQTPLKKTRLETTKKIFSFAVRKISTAIAVLLGLAIGGTVGIAAGLVATPILVLRQAKRGSYKSLLMQHKVNILQELGIFTLGALTSPFRKNWQNWKNRERRKKAQIKNLGMTQGTELLEMRPKPYEERHVKALSIAVFAAIDQLYESIKRTSFLEKYTTFGQLKSKLRHCIATLPRSEEEFLGSTSYDYLRSLKIILTTLHEYKEILSPFAPQLEKKLEQLDTFLATGELNHTLIYPITEAIFDINKFFSSIETDPPASKEMVLLAKDPDNNTRLPPSLGTSSPSKTDQSTPKRRRHSYSSSKDR